MDLPGEITSNQILNLRFPSSGKISELHFQVGQQVKKGQLLARLNQTQQQTYLDRALKQYEKERADFEERQKEKMSEFDRAKTQLELDISVKNVELAKQNLEDTNLYAPINGIVIASDPTAVGLNITPATATITILDPNSLYFQAQAKEEDLAKIVIGQQAQVTLKSLPNTVLSGQVEHVGFLASKTGYPVTISVSNRQNLRLGLSGKASLK